MAWTLVSAPWYPVPGAHSDWLIYLATHRRVKVWLFSPPGRLFRPAVPLPASKAPVVARLEAQVWLLLRLAVRCGAGAVVVLPSRGSEVDGRSLEETRIFPSAQSVVLHASGLGSPWPRAYSVTGVRVDVSDAAVAGAAVDSDGLVVPDPEGASQRMWPAAALKLTRACGDYVRMVSSPQFADPPAFQTPWSNGVSRGGPWRVLAEWTWARPSHINIQEAGAERRLIRSLCHQGFRGRFNLLEDSRVTILSGAKGRSSSRALRYQLGLSLPYQLGGNLYPGRHYTPSKLMPADHPSRGRSLPPLSAAAPGWLGPAGSVRELELWLSVPAGKPAVAEWGRFVLILGRRYSALWSAGTALGRAFRSNSAGDGPRRRGGAAQGLQPDLPSHRNLAEATIDSRDRCLGYFSQWLLSVPGAPDLVTLVMFPDILNLALEAYGRALYRHHRPRGEYLNTILAVVDCRRNLRRLLSPAWEFAELWRSFQPGRNRNALPKVMLDAFTVEALARGWIRWAACVRLGFFGIHRPGEILSATRGDLTLPSDLFRSVEQDCRCYLKVRAPKTRHAGARQQYGRCDDLDTTRLWLLLADGADVKERLWSGSDTKFRVKWNQVCATLMVPSSEAEGVTPGSLRGGGASWLYESSEDIELVRHRGRWGSHKMCEIYIQEVGSQTFLVHLPPAAREAIFQRARLVEEAVHLAIRLVEDNIPLGRFFKYFNDLACRTTR